MKETLDKIEKYCDFSDPNAVYIMIMLPRKKENKEQTEREKLQKRSRYIVSNMDEVKFALEDFERYTKMYPELIFRVYISVNRRSLRKGLREYKKKIAEIDDNLIGGNTQVWTQVQKLGSEFKSVLASKDSKHDRWWQFDIDITNDKTDVFAQDIVNEFKERVDKLTDIIYFGETKSNYVMITRGFDENKLSLPADVEIKKDGYLYVGVYND
jgi:hypothetical protein